jgi:hypothetical protein
MSHLIKSHGPLPRDHTGRLPSFTSVGSYTIVYYCADGGELCPACANGDNGSDATEDPEADSQWRLIGCDVYWEGPVLQCAHCNADIESSYGDPDADSASEATS